MNSLIPQEFYYHLGWRTRSAQPGTHPTRTVGGNADFQNFVPFMENPNPRRIDLRATLRTLPRQLMSRAYHERGAIAVYAVLDLSASMRFTGNSDKLNLVADIVASAAWSAVRSGDAFGLVACDDTVRLDLFAPPSHRLGLADEIRNKLLADLPANTQSDASALPLAAQQLRQKRSLVFLISDFHLPDALLTKTFTSLAPHDVVPLVLWDSAEYHHIPTWGWVRVRDMESGGYRSIFLRPSLMRQIKASYTARRQTIIAQCLQAGTRAPFFIEDTFNAEQLTRHLLEAS
ncbi:DUF58 domain-containing protein [Methylotenera sp.]|uniref:DUF58 domain-containing protein n=1 Tax=Methylotenera sp. TaxID=2051956 RepID=UPI00272830C7|nr:DUF58 domain-containing protein [Methylotenera sp.]MDO9203942.1 DUF58 domain-containing protein [Methylotenera sp.]MDO9393208.1 DUF58 domain-containing protein [Methylotenera sp.]MDP1522429.1 DUF58 domain-containing protein [Methylotenera sp.]MDP2072481.1 DUF58 domain-containing protein [Methylotenera sp.]MDP2229512.1 DUF58 domain-containing protein [Methylotenera sp.]